MLNSPNYTREEFSALLTIVESLERENVYRPSNVAKAILDGKPLNEWINIPKVAWPKILLKINEIIEWHNADAEIIQKLLDKPAPFTISKFKADEMIFDVGCYRFRVATKDRLLSQEMKSTVAETVLEPIQLWQVLAMSYMVEKVTL